MMKRVAAMVVALVCVVVGLGQAEKPKAGVKFVAVDVFVDSGAAALAAYQVDMKETRGNVAIVGIEGGEAGAYSGAPYYDPLAMQHERVILAGLSTAKDLPTGRTRVARVHVQVTGDGKAQWACTLVTAGDRDGKRIAATAVAVQQGEGT